MAAIFFPKRRLFGIITPTKGRTLMKENKVSNERLNHFFHDMTRRSFWQLGINDATVARYVADVLTEFASTNNLRRPRSHAGKRLDSVVDMLNETAEPAGENNVMKERELRKYLGDYTLFMSGIFRTHVEKSGCLDYYLEEGQRSYRTVSELDVSLYRTGFILFEELSKKFEYYSGALDYMRKAYFAPEPGGDPFAGWFKQLEGWITTNLTEN